MNRLYTLHDYDIVNGDETLLNLQEKIKNSSSVLVIGDGENSQSNNKQILQYYNGDWMISGCIGFLEYTSQENSTTYIIKSRFDKEERNDFSNYMLEKALQYKSNIFDDMHPNANKEYLFRRMLAIVLFQQIKKAYKKGIFRQYITYEKNDSHPKGRIDIDRHKKLNPLFNGKIAYSNREYTIDNYINQLILTAFQFLKEEDSFFIKSLLKQYDTVNQYFAELRNVITPVNKHHCVGLLNRTSKKIQHSYYKEWEDVRRTAVLIIKRFGMVASKKSSKEQIFGVLFKMSSLWEKYIESILKKDNIFKNVGIQQTKNIFIDENQVAVTHMKPDFIFPKHSMVLDAKYKMPWSKYVENPGKMDNKGVLRSDCFQIISYMHIFQYKNGGVVCPQTKKELDKLEYKLIADANSNEKFCIFPIAVQHDVGSYYEYCKKMEETERQWLDLIIRSIPIVNI
ncbi:MAG: hypothetical protein PUG10_02365 [Lachnospiraceae bacterium]|nr:hypothetical protein [Lachnospiraceae bacterium]